MIKHLLILVGLAWVFAGSSTPAASFNCARATTAVEKNICRNKKLSELDSQLGKIYSDLVKTPQLKKEQGDWLKRRDQECSTDVLCLLNIYQERISELTKVDRSSLEENNNKSTDHHWSPRQFDSIPELIEWLGGYRLKGQFKMLSDSHFQLSPLESENQFPEYIEETVRRTLLSAIYRVFVHTKLDSISVTVVPLDDLSDRILKDYQMTITVTRQKVLTVSRRMLGISSLDSLITQREGFNDVWTEEFEPTLYKKWLFDAIASD